MSQSPWSTVITSTPTSPRITRATSARARPRSVAGSARRCRRSAHRREVVDGVERRPHRGAERCSVAVPQRVQRRAPALVVSHSSSPGIRTESTSPADITGSGPNSEVGDDAAADVEALERRAAGVGADQPVEPADAGVGAGVGVLDLLHRGEVRAVRRRQPGRVDGGQLAGVPQRQQRRELGVQPEHAVLGEQPVGRDGDPRAGRVVDGVGVRHDQRQPVGGAAQREHDQHRRRGRARRRPRW